MRLALLAVAFAVVTSSMQNKQVVNKEAVKVLTSLNAGSKDNNVVLETKKFKNSKYRESEKQRRENQEDPTTFVGRWRQMFESCPRTCGGAYQKAIITMCWSDKEKKEIDATNCPPKPSMYAACGQQPCLKPKWELGEWSGCSVTCGVGISRQMYRCVIFLGNRTGVREVETRMCEDRKVSEKPAERKCNTNITCVDVNNDRNKCTGPKCKITIKPSAILVTTSGSSQKSGNSSFMNTCSHVILLFTLVLYRII